MCSSYLNEKKDNPICAISSLQRKSETTKTDKDYDSLMEWHDYEKGTLLYIGKLRSKCLRNVLRHMPTPDELIWWAIAIKFPSSSAWSCCRGINPKWVIYQKWCHFMAITEIRLWKALFTQSLNNLCTKLTHHKQHSLASMQVCHTSYKGNDCHFIQHGKPHKQDLKTEPNGALYQNDAVLCVMLLVREEHCFHNHNNPITACVPNLHTYA